MKFLFLRFIAFTTFFFPIASNAGYAQLSPPAGFTTSAPSYWQGEVGKSFYKVAANESFSATKTVLTSASLNVGGRAVVMPASMRMAANAGRFMAKGLSLNPAWLIAGAAAPYLADWLANRYWSNPDGTWSAKNVSVQLEWQSVNYGGLRMWGTSQEICAAIRTSMPYPSGPLSVSYGGGIVGSIGEIANCGFNGIQVQVLSKREVNSTPRVLTPGQFVEEIENAPFPARLPDFYPHPVPVEIPVVNPASTPVPAPQPAPGRVSKPVRIPQGDPQLVPDSNPKRWEAPVIDVIPSPTPEIPWRVDIVPRTVTTETGDPLPDRLPIPETPKLPNGDPDPNAPPDSKPKPEAEKDLCLTHPDISACKPLGEVQDSPMPSIPKLYEPKYPEGLKGVWAQKKDQLKSSPLMSILSTLMPSGLTGGACPEMSINLDVGFADFGSHDVAPPCWIWTFGKVVIVVSALILARALIFGG